MHPPAVITQADAPGAVIYVKHGRRYYQIDRLGPVKALAVVEIGDAREVVSVPVTMIPELIQLLQEIPR
jgi:hypothetical protein